jgi:hypothetical protein
MRILKLYPLSKFQICNTLTLVTMQYCRSPEFIHLLIARLYLKFQKKTRVMRVAQTGLKFTVLLPQPLLCSSLVHYNLLRLYLMTSISPCPVSHQPPPLCSLFIINRFWKSVPHIQVYLIFKQLFRLPGLWAHHIFQRLLLC